MHGQRVYGISGDVDRLGDKEYRDYVRDPH